MLCIRKHNSIGNKKQHAGRKKYSTISAVLLILVTAFSPVSAREINRSGLPFAVAAAASETTAEDASTSETGDTAAEAASDSAAVATTAASDSAAAARTVSSAAAASSSASTAASTAAASAAETAAPVDEAMLSTPPGQRGIHVHLASAPGAPQPAKTIDTDTASLLKLISVGLTVLDENNDPVPGCAESWEVSEDGLEWTFHLRSGLKWSDGTDLEASDFVSLFRKTAAPATEALYGTDLTQNIAGYEDVLKGKTEALQVYAGDARTLIVKLSSPDPSFARSCASWALLPVREQIEAEENAAPVSDWTSVTGNGPYYIAAVVPGQDYILKKNPFYKPADESAGKPFDHVRWTVSGDINQEYSDFLNGEIDAISNIPAEEERMFRIEGGIQNRSLPDTMGICFNCRHEVLSDPLVRRALSLSIDREFIASTILQDAFLPEGSDGQGDSGDVESHVHRAGKLLEEAGYADGEGIPELTCIADESSGALLTAEYLASVWRDLGIRIRVKSVNADELAREKAEGTFDIFCSSIYLASDLPEAELARFKSDDENNISGFNSGEYDRLITEAQETADEDEHEDLIRQAFELLEDEMPAVPLAKRCVSWLRKEEHPGIGCDSTGCWQLWDVESPDLSVENTDGTGISEVTDGRKAAADHTAAGTGDHTGAGLNEEQHSTDAGTVQNAATAGSAQNTAREVTASIPEMDPVSGSDNLSNSLPRIEEAGSGSRQKHAALKNETALDRIRSSDTYFLRTNETAYLISQAWLYDKADPDAEPVVSVPKYSEVHLTGTGNSRFARIERDGKIWYVKAYKVTTDTARIDAARAGEKAKQAQRDLLAASLHPARESELADRAEDVRIETEEILEAIARREKLRTQTRNPNWDGPVLSRGRGSVMGPSGKETYYNLNMSGVVSIMRRMGNTDEYWVRDDGCKMLGDYIMCAANLRVHPRGTLVECSLGTCIVCDTGGFASRNSHQLDIAVTW